MTESQRYPAFLAYLLTVPGWIYVFAFHRKNKFATYHTVQSIGLALVLLGVYVAWLVLTWLLCWIPLLGPLVGMMAFSLVMAALTCAVVSGLVGMSNALRGRMVPLPLIGRWVLRLPLSRLIAGSEIT